MTCDRWDVVVVPFPFTDKPVAKRRPTVVLSRESFNREGHTVLAMITTKLHRPWPGDVAIDDWVAAGLGVPCIVRLKLFTLDNRLILERKGRLRGRGAAALEAALDDVLGMAGKTAEPSGGAAHRNQVWASP